MPLLKFSFRRELIWNFKRGAVQGSAPPVISDLVILPLYDLFFDLNPNAVSASVEERRLKQPDPLAINTEALCAQVEVPVGTGQPELISGCRSVSWRGVDRGIRRRRIAVLDGLKRVDTGNQRRPEADSVKLHRDGAVQLKGPNRIHEAASVPVFNRTTNRRKEAIERAAGSEHGYRTINVYERVVIGHRCCAGRWINTYQRTNSIRR